MGNAYFFTISFLEEIYIQPALLAVFSEGDAAGDSFVVAFHVEVMSDVGVIIFFIRIAFATRNEGFFVFPHHLEIGIGHFDSSFSPRRIEVRTAVLRPFPASAKVAVRLVFGKVVTRLLVGASLFFFGGKRQRSKVFGSTVFIDFVEASLTPVVAEEIVRCCRR